jgi:uncharacterized membrane protein
MAEEIEGVAEQSPEESPVESPMDSGEVTDDDRLWGLLSWLLWPLAVAALLMESKKGRPFIKYNAVCSLAFSVVLYVVGTITFGCLLLVGWVYMIILAIQAYQGRWVEVPFLSDFVKKQGWA